MATDDVIYQGVLKGSDGSEWSVRDARLSVAPSEPGPTPTPTPVPIVAPIGGTPNAVRIGTSTYPLSGINPTRTDYPGGRGPNQLVAYQAPVTTTTTNPYGAEVQVVAGVCGPLADRQPRGVAVGTPVPSAGYVLSGHGKAREWLLANARAGSNVELLTLEAPTPTPAAAGAVPAWVVGGYWQQYQGPRVSAVSPAYNMVFVAFALGNGAANMSFQPYAQDETSFIAEVAASKARGVTWILSLGGGVPKDKATYLRSQAEVDQCYRTLVPIIDKYGFQGIDYDLENGPSGFTGDALLSLSRKLKDHYGPQFIVTVVPRPYESFYFEIAGKLHAAGVLDLLMFQFYDAPETRDSTYLAAWIPRILDQAKAKGVPYNMMVVGAITYTKYNLGWNTIAVYRQVIEDMRRTRGIRGAFIWEISLDAKEGWSFANQIGAVA